MNSSLGLIIFFRTSLANWTSIDVLVREAKAPIRMRGLQDSDVRNQFEMPERRPHHSEEGYSSISAFFLRMATLVSVSGGWNVSDQTPFKTRSKRLQSWGYLLETLSLSQQFVSALHTGS